MNKVDAIKKINKIGKAGKIITTIALVFTIISFVGTTIGGIIIANFPKNGLEIGLTNEVEICIDAASFNEDIENMTEEDIINSINEDAGVKFVGGSDETTGITNINSQQVVINDISVEDNVIRIKCATSDQKMTFSNLITLTILIDISFLALGVSLVFGKNLCKAFEVCESPFEATIVNKMRAFAFSLIPWVLLSSVPNMIMANLFGSGLKITANIDLGVIFVVLTILALSYIFKYGAVLQQESDETL